MTSFGIWITNDKTSFYAIKLPQKCKNEKKILCECKNEKKIMWIYFWKKKQQQQQKKCMDRNADLKLCFNKSLLLWRRQS